VGWTNESRTDDAGLDDSHTLSRAFRKSILVLGVVVVCAGNHLSDRRHVH
jgi:hypothetical protein